MQQVVVLAKGQGWAVRSTALDRNLGFASGAKAGAAARRLGELLAAAGEAAEVGIHVSDGSLAGRFLLPADLC